MELEAGLRRAIEAATGDAVRSMAVVRGGDVAASFDVRLASGRRLFAKTHPDPPPGFFTTEASGLRWLAAAGAVRCPDVVAVGDRDGEGDDGEGDDGEGDGQGDVVAHLVLEWIEEGRPLADTDAVLGRQLAELHDAGAPCFGREDRATTGSRRLPNDPHDRWSDFYADCRLRPLARLARQGAALPEASITALERLAGKLEGFDDGAPPARLHGDLWAGNRLIDVHGESWLLDPAAHGGHREFDLAMMRLFGGFSAACFAAYEERDPLAPGWEERVRLHQIAPLVVHAIKFGGGYVGAAAEAIAAY